MAPKKRKEVPKDFVDQELPEDSSEDEDYEAGNMDEEDDASDEEDDGSDDEDDDIEPASESLVTPMDQAAFNSVFKQAPPKSKLAQPTQ